MDWNPPAPDWSAPAAVSGLTAPEKAAAPPRSAAPSAPSGTTAPAGQETSDDPWARAVEQSPGVWTVGADTNIGRDSAPDTAMEPGDPAEPQYYEPAAAQIPEDPAGSALPATAPVAADGWTVPTQPAPVPATAVAVAVAATLVGDATAPVPVPASPAAALAGRQSLYQRLSNSPEAEAGRAKAPSRAAAGTAVQVQDIPSADDETIEESGVFGRAAVERILGGKLVEERALDGSPLPPRF